MSKYRREETSSEDTDSEEERRKKDIKERDSFASRLRAKDESKRRNVATLPGSGAGKWPKEYLWMFNIWEEVTYCLFLSAAEAAKRLKIMETDTKDKLIPKLRIESRRKYLEKRKEDKVAELEADILDDEYLFDENT